MDGRSAEAGESGSGDTPGRSSLALSLLSLVLVGSSVAVFAIWAWLAAAHVDDRYRVDQVSGVHLALAWEANHGRLYPPLYDGEAYGGTRYMPLPILIDATAARLGENYLVSGKVLSYGYFLGLMIVLVVLLRKMRCPWSLTAGLTAMVATTETVFAASMNARSDLLPVLLQIGAVGLILHRRGPIITVVASGLASLAFITKGTAVWGAMAIALWLVLENRRALLQFGAAYLAFTGALVGAFAWASHGRIFENVVGLSAAGITGVGPLVRSPYRFFHEAVPYALAGWALVPAVAVAVWWAVRSRPVSIWLLSLGFHVPVLMIMLADRGVGWNQLVDFVVLSALVVGELSGRVSQSPHWRFGAIGLLAGTVLWMNLSGLALLFGPEIKKSFDPAFQETLTPYPLGDRVQSTTRILAEDPYVPISLDRRPVVLDPFMLIAIGRRDPSAVQELVGRINDGEFDLVVLRVALEDRSMAWWFREEAFGAAVAKALRDRYAYSARVSGYHVYEPAPTA
jgi:hypothetical protein